MPSLPGTEGGRRRILAALAALAAGLGLLWMSIARREATSVNGGGNPFAAQAAQGSAPAAGWTAGSPQAGAPGAPQAMRGDWTLPPHPPDRTLVKPEPEPAAPAAPAREEAHVIPAPPEQGELEARTLAPAPKGVLSGATLTGAWAPPAASTAAVAAAPPLPPPAPAPHKVRRKLLPIPDPGKWGIREVPRGPEYKTDRTPTSTTDGTLGPPPIEIDMTKAVLVVPGEGPVDASTGTVAAPRPPQAKRVPRSPEPMRAP